MKKFSKEINEMLKTLTNEIMEEYDNSKEISVRVNLLPQSHNAMSEFEKDNDKETIQKHNGKIQAINEHNKHADPINIAIHETSLGKKAEMEDGLETNADDIERPTKPDAWTRSFERYDKLVRDGAGANPRRYGSTIAYHARVDYPGLMGRPEIVIIEPAVCSPDQITNKELAAYTYGIERCVGEEQNYHLAIANQAMLTAFVLREMGYDKDTAMRHIFPHNFFAKNNKACPARMLYASTLLRKSQKEKLTEQEIEDIKEYVPWEVYMKLVKTFLERDKYPQQLEEKFIYDMSDYEAYMKSPKEYNYRQRKPLEKIKKREGNELVPRKERFSLNSVTLNKDEDER